MLHINFSRLMRKSNTTYLLYESASTPTVWLSMSTDPPRLFNRRHYYLVMPIEEYHILVIDTRGEGQNCYVQKNGQS